MARMLGRYQVPGCCPGTRAGRPPGPDCSGGGSTGTRAARRREDRELDREFAAWASWYDSGEGREWLEAGLAEAEGWPGWDFSDCRHGCNGDCLVSGSDVCDFLCHPGLTGSGGGQHVDLS